MLKACWDCLVGDGTRPEEPYGTQLNGNLSRSPPPWPQATLRNEKMFLLPKELAPRDQITMKIESSRQDTLKIGLVTDNNGPDYNNIACQVDLQFLQNILSVKMIENGAEEIVENEGNYTPSNVIGGNAFKVVFTMREEDNWIDIALDGSILYTFQAKHDFYKIRYLTVNGDVVKVNSLEFRFG